MGVFTSSRQVRQNIYLMPGWWLSDASIDLDFQNARYYDSSLGASASLAPLNSYLSISRASTGYAQNSAGTWVAFGNDTLRITDRGLLIEDARTNYLLNSDAPATQTTGSLSTGSYTLWVEGSGSALASAGSATITGAASATDGSPDTFTVTGAGTVTITVTGSLTRFQLEAGAFASSFILTAGASATRAADSIIFAGALSTLAKALPQTMLVDLKLVAAATGQWHIISDASGGDWNPIWFNASNTVLSSNMPGGFLTKNISPSLWTDGNKATVAMASSARSVTAAGLSVSTDANAAAGGTNVGFGADPFVYIRRATFWNSKLADATLQSLTTP